MKVVTYFHTSVSATVTIDDVDLNIVAEWCGVEKDELTDDMIIEWASNKASEDGFGGLCAHCSGWGQKWSQDISDWEPDDEAGTITER